MRRLLILTFLLQPLFIFEARADFVGALDFTPKGCETLKLCKLIHDFGYLDSKGLGWQANAGDDTDGATIPDWAQSFIGGNFDQTFIKAAVIHDHYCNNHVRTWRATHLMLYDALISSGVPLFKAQIMYYAVYTGGPRWIELAKGAVCPIGKMCISSERMLNDPAVHMMSNEGGDLLVRDEDYSSPAFKMKMDKVHAFMAAKGDTMTANDLSEFADALAPADVFAKQPDGALMSMPAGK